MQNYSADTYKKVLCFWLLEKNQNNKKYFK